MMGDIGGWQPPGVGSTPQQTAGVTDVVTQLQGIVSQLSNLVKSTNNLVNAVTDRAVGGTFTATAATSTVVAQPVVQSQSTITITPTNAAASTLIQAHGYFITKSVGVGFTITFGAAAAGTETFSYLVNTPT